MMRILDVLWELGNKLVAVGRFKGEKFLPGAGTTRKVGPR
jgi:hypothetical protein